MPSTDRDTDGAGLLLLSMSMVASFSWRLRCLLFLRTHTRHIASKQTPVCIFFAFVSCRWAKKWGEGGAQRASASQFQNNFSLCVFSPSKFSIAGKTLCFPLLGDVTHNGNRTAKTNRDPSWFRATSNRKAALGKKKEHKKTIKKVVQSNETHTNDMTDSNGVETRHTTKQNRKEQNLGKKKIARQSPPAQTPMTTPSFVAAEVPSVSVDAGSTPTGRLAESPQASSSALSTT